MMIYQLIMKNSIKYFKKLSRVSWHMYIQMTYLMLRKNEKSYRHFVMFRFVKIWMLYLFGRGRIIQCFMSSTINTKIFRKINWRWKFQIKLS